MRITRQRTHERALTPAAGFVLVAVPLGVAGWTGLYCGVSALLHWLDTL